MLFIRAFIALMLIVPALANGEPTTKAPLTLGEVDGESDADSSTVNIRFNRKPDFESVSVSSHGSFIQIDLPGTLVPNPGAFIDGNSPYIKKIAIFQLTNKDGAVRLFVSESAAKIQNAMRAEILGKRILVTVDHSQLVDRQVAAAPATQAPARVSSSEKTITPADVVLGRATAEEAGFATGGIDFRDKLVKISAFIGGLLFFAVLALMMRPLLRRKRRGNRGNGSNEIEEVIPAMSTLATMPIGPKQKLSLIQVGDQKILIAIGPESATFMTTIGTPPAPAPAPAAAVAAPQASLPTGYGQQVPAMSQMLAQAQLAQAQAVQQQPAGRAPAASARNPFESAVAQATDQPQIKLKQRPAAPIPQDENEAGAEKVVMKTKRKTTGQRLNIAVGDDGVKNLAKNDAREGASADPKTIEDVTQLIRQKLQTFKAL